MRNGLREDHDKVGAAGGRTPEEAIFFMAAGFVFLTETQDQESPCPFTHRNIYSAAGRPGALALSPVSSAALIK